MYTEMIFGARLKKDTPAEVIDVLHYMIGNTTEKPGNFPLPKGRCESLLMRYSESFGVNSPVVRLWQDEVFKEWILSARISLKNYDGEINTFLRWIKPYIKSGSGTRDMYAIVTYEESESPTIYYLN